MTQSGAAYRPATIQNVQFLRAVAALSCVLAHLHVFVSGAFGLQTELGGVDLFFVISGFIIAYTTTNVDISPRKFMARRIIRIVPLYWLTTIGVFLLATAGLIGTVTTDFGALLQSLFFIPFRKDNDLVQPTWFVGWTLNYEMFFYALFALALFVRHALVRIIGVMFALTALVAWNYFTQPENTALAFLSAPYLLDFVMGLGVFLVTQVLPAKKPKGGVTIALLASIVGFVGAMAGPVLYPDTHTAITCGLPSVFLVAGAIALERWGWKITSPGMILLGDASYSIYLLHPFVTMGLTKLTHGLVLDGMDSLVLVTAGLTLSIIVGVIAYGLIERPLGGRAKTIRFPGAPRRPDLTDRQQPA